MEARKHENYKELVWILAKTDFKLRYHGSVLGYLWAILNPLLIFSILNFIFSSVFARGAGIKHYTLQLLVSLVIFFFFQEGTKSGMASLLSKSSLVTKIYVPRWTIILSSTINAALIFLMNLLVIIIFFMIKGFAPSIQAVTMFALSSIMVYILVLSFSLMTSSWYVKYRDLGMIWDVALRALMYAVPIIYPLQMLPGYIQKIILINPVAFIIHFNKEALINNHFPDFWQSFIFIVSVLVFFVLSLYFYKKDSVNVAENI